MTELATAPIIRRKLKQTVRRWVLPSAAAISLFVIAMLGQSVFTDLRELRSAQSDTVQWTLSQVEIEYLDFQLSLRSAAENPSPDLETLRRDFDVFFSRHDIIAQGLVFQDARQISEFETAQSRIKSFLDAAAPLLDAADADLVAALPALMDQTKAIRPAVRGLYVSGLTHFADASDQLRARLSATLLELSAISGLLIISLIALVLYSRAADASSRARGRELASANAHMQTILSTSLDGVIVSDHTGIILDFNAAAERIFGYSNREAVGQSIGDLIVPPALRDAHQAGMKRMHDTGQKKLVGNGRIRIDAMRKDKTIFPVELALQSGEGSNGEILIAFLRDISAQVESEDELTEARDQALAGEKAKAEFLTVMSHEIRTPLSGLLGNLTLLGSTSLTSEQQQFQNNMAISGRQLLKHVNSILDIARFESGRLPIKEESFHLGRFLQEVVDSQSAGAEQRSTAMSWGWVGDALEWVRSDKGHLEQVLLNLVGNAVKFTENGRVDIEVEQVGLRGASPLVEIRVIDTGLGIDEADHDRIFEEFETTHRAGGDTGSTGLGLPIAKRLVTLLGGEIGVESTLDEGSAFWVRLPLPEGHEPKDSNNDIIETQSNPLRLLLVEDNEMNAFVVEKMLRAEGHSVILATDGFEALDWAGKADFDGILMDINMPRLDGLEATKRIRKSVKRAAKTSIFAFSANVLPDDTKRFRESGMDGFIGKPVQIEELRAALASITETPAPMPLQKTVAGHERSQAKEMFGDQYDEFLKRFVAEGDDLDEWLSHPITDIEDLGQRCHKIASTAALFGAIPYQKALQRVEEQSKSAEVSDEAIEGIRLHWTAAKAGLTSP
ncbi:MAG: response regulator [Cognatishimia sp.]|uniref:hybrid sensor histidine kinase/response regulator n=1 Tax=Cognatishimia sp. TaxID=2211648 RepID=UPI003B8B2116